MKIYGFKPLTNESAVVNCNDCSKKILPRGYTEHLENCEKIKERSKEPPIKIEASDTAAVDKNHANISTDSRVKNELAGSEETTTSSAFPKQLVSTPASTSSIPAKRQPSSPSAGKSSNEKKQKVKKNPTEKKKGNNRNKGPIDLDRQCGVLMQPNNTPCTRSLTCKSHSMSLKRGVAGRSRMFDDLLQAYQKKSIGRPLNGNQANSKSDNKKDGKPDAEEVEEVVNSEEEVDAVIEAIMSSTVQPLAARQSSYVSRTHTNYFLYQDVSAENVAKAVW